jgi:hypothetical protein
MFDTIRLRKTIKLRRREEEFNVGDEMSNM